MTGKAVGWVGIGSAVAILLGGFLGYRVPLFMETFGFIGDLFVYGLLFVSLTWIVISAIAGISQMGNRGKLSRAAGKALLYFFALGLAGSIIGVVVAEIIRPGDGIGHLMTDLYKDWAPVKPFAVSWPVVGGIVFVAVMLGGGLISFGARARAITNLLSQSQMLLQKVVAGMTQVAPLGLLFLVGALVARDDFVRSAVGGLFGAGPSSSVLFARTAASYLLTVVAGFLFLSVVVLPLILKIFGRRSVLSLLSSLGSASLVSFGASSSLAALSLTQSALADKHHIDNRAVGLVLPFGMLAGTAATALCVVVGTLFLTQSADIQLSVWQYILLMVLPLLLAFGRVGLPYPQVPVMLVLIAALGLPTVVAAGLGMILVVEWLVDRIRSAVNTWADSVGVAVIAETFEFKTARSTRGPAQERQPARAGRPLRGKPDRPTPERRRVDSRTSRRGRDRKDDRRHTPRSTGRTPVRSAGTSLGRQRPTPSASSPSTRRSPFEMSTDRAPEYDMDLTGPDTGGAARDQAATPAKQRRNGREKPTQDSRTQERGAFQRASQTRPEAKRGKPGDRKPEPETPAVKAVSDGRLSPEVIARELKKVSAQIDRSEVNGSADKSAPSDKPPEKSHSTEVPDSSADENVSLPVAADTPGDREVNESVESPESIIVDKPSHERADDSKTNEQIPKPDPTKGDAETAEIRYGRGPTRRGDAMRKNSPPVNNDSEESDVKNGFAQEEISSFGRGKRKRTK
ncbi:MAG: cation:dicarboxylase symporter family transporter [Candidatus Zixiibacteriota bacterium]|nr:MAG: cation:dicarboxylase symporter family transporter [candidate division Zixibacteria bacterium]